MGKFRGHQDKSRRGREKKLLKKKAAAAGVAGAGTALAGGFGAEGTGDGGKKRKSTKHVTYSKDHSVLICGDGDFSFTRGVIRHRGTGYVFFSFSFFSPNQVSANFCAHF